MPQRAARELLDFTLVPLDGMAREIEAQALLLEGQALALGPARHVGESAAAAGCGHRRGAVVHHAEEVRLAGFAIGTQAR